MTGPSDRLTLLAQLVDADEAVLMRAGADEIVTLAEGPGLARLGIARRAPVGAPLVELFGAESDLLFRWRHCLAGDKFRIEHVVGDAQWLLSFHPQRGPDGAPTGASMVGLEVTRDLTVARQSQLLRELINNVPTNVYAVDLDGRCELSEGGLLVRAGLKPGQNVGLDVFRAYAGVPAITDSLRAALRGESRTVEYEFAGVLFSQTTLPRRDALGAVAGAFCIVSDITERRRDEELLREQVRIIQAQKQAITLLSSPIIEVWEDVLAVPLVGSIEHERAAVIMQGLLDAIARKRSRVAILDLTGVETVDPSSAEHLVRIIRSVRLLGAEAVITGIRPAIAQTMASLGLDLSDLTIHAALQDALRHYSVRDRPRPR
jgi:anti-anti-sigma factor